MRCMVLLILSCALLTAPVSARPPHRQKRVSDQRLAELETLLALSRLKNKYVTLPVAYGLINVKDIGRRKRSMGFVDVGRHDLQQEELSQEQQFHPNRPMIRDDPSTTDYDLSEIVANLPSSDHPHTSSESLKDATTLLEGSYADEDEPTAMDLSQKDREAYLAAGGLRSATGSRRPFYLGLRVPTPYHQRVY